MCTLTWSMREEGYELFFNRDESRTRLPALEPTIETDENVRYIAPTDADAGGTWIGVNEYGIAACLLNFYQGEKLAAFAPPETQQSRGIIVRELLRIPDLTSGEVYLEHLDSERFRPFRALLFSPGETAPRSYLWSGRGEIERESASIPVSSSGFLPEKVVPERKRIFQRLLRDEASDPPDRKFFYRYHAAKSEEGGAYSVRMEREDAMTVSFTHIAVDQKRAILYYLDEPLSLGRTQLLPKLPSWRLPLKD